MIAVDVFPSVSGEIMQWPWSKPKEDVEPPRPPKVGGTRAPENVLSIDFGRPHDFHVRFEYCAESYRVFRRCVVVGYTTPNAAQAEEWQENFSGHDRWLVLRQPDGRLVYFRREAILYIEESADGEQSSK